MRTWWPVALAVALQLAVLPMQAQNVCGNGTRESGEDCDDGNLYNADGCSASCTFRQPRSPQVWRSAPERISSPAEGLRSPASTLTSVDFPPPDAP